MRFSNFATLEISSSETVLENLQEIKDADPGMIRKFLEELGHNALSLALEVLIAIVVFFVGGRIIKFVRKLLAKALEKRDTDKGLAVFLDSFVNVSLYVVLIFIILSFFGVTTASIAAVLGSLGLTIGLALQGSLANFAGGILILFLRPFRVGDYIMESHTGKEGTVTAITIFYTKLLTVDHKIVVIPNGKLSDASITNVTGMKKRRLILNAGISYESDLKKAKEILRTLLEEDPDRIEEDPVEVYVDALGESAVELGARCWVKTENYWPCRWRILEEIKERFDEAGIEIPYNKLDIQIKGEPHESKL